MSRITFPPNPPDGQIFEALPGLYYQYRKADNSWIRIDGVESLPNASPLQDGLMTSDDLRKLLNLIIPPPQASLKGEDCQLIFRQGKIGIYSSDGSLRIAPKLSLMNKAAQTQTDRPWDIHRNTVGIEFTLNLNQFINEVKKRGKIIETQLIGDKGSIGDIGDAGRDKLDTGPTGGKGLDGANSPFGGSLAQESLGLEVTATDETRAIVDLTTEKISEDENYLVVTRATVGNPDACPSEISPLSIKSPWLLVVQPGVTTINKLTKLTDDCGVPCAICSSSVHYVNIDPIIDMIFSRFKDRVIALKKAKEDLVSSWLKSMVYLFNQQKAALCCALENCRSRTRNVSTRQYIESQRIQAALGNFSLVVDGADDKMTVNLDEFKDCLAKGHEPTSQYVVEHLGAGCGEWLYEITVDASVHNRDPRNAGNASCLVFNLPPGSYYAEVIGCCAQLGTAAVAQGAMATEMVMDENGKVTAAGDVVLDSKAFDGAPVPGRPGYVYLHNLKGERVETKILMAGNPNTLTYNTRKGYKESSQYTGRVAILYNYALESGSAPEGTDPDSALPPGVQQVEQKIVTLPNLGKYGDPSVARSGYLGLTARFTHSGGPILMWIPDAEATGLPSSGSVKLGIQKVECLDNYLDYVTPANLSAAIAQATDFEAPIFVYRTKVSAANVVGVLRPYKGDQTSISNYGLSGGNAHLGTGPGLEGRVLKVFFYQGADGLSCYMIQNAAGVMSNNKSRIIITEKNNSTGSAVLLSNEPGELIPVDSPSAKKLLDLPLNSHLYDGLFEYVNRTAGGIVGMLDDLTEVRAWEIILDPLDTGDITMIKGGDGKDNTEIVLAQGPVKINFDYSTLRQPLGAETETESETPAAWGNELSVSTGAGEDSWWFRFVGDPGGPKGGNPYSLFDGTYDPHRASAGMEYGIFSAMDHQNIRLWRDYQPNGVEFIGAVDGSAGGNWAIPSQTPRAIRIYSINSDAGAKFADATRPITITDLKVLCTCYGANATTFSVTVIDDDGNLFEFPDRTISRNTFDVNTLTWVSFGAPTNDEVIVIESDPSILETPPTGTIIGTEVRGQFKKQLDLRKVRRIIVDIKRAEKDKYVLGIHTISAMLDGMARWPSDSQVVDPSKGVAEPQAYAILEGFAVYWRYEVPANGWPKLPDNVINDYLSQWWPPQALTDIWSMIPDFSGESLDKKPVIKNPLEEIKANRLIFTTIPPTDGCQMFWKQVEWLERGHRIGAACSFYIVIDGMGFIVVKRSIGIDMACGGGESADNPCIANFVAAGEGHPAIAWPSTNGEEFIGKPTSGYVTFIKDADLSQRILEKLGKGEITKIHGDPINSIPFILFPSI
jgi:hypothetical protein